LLSKNITTLKELLMSKRIIISVLVCCVHIVAMEKSWKDPRDQLFSIISKDRENIPLSYEHARHMMVFSPFNPDNLSFRSKHSAREIDNFLHVLDKIKDKTISQSCFPFQYSSGVIPTKAQVALPIYEQFDLRLNPEIPHNRKPIELMSVARELKDEQAMLVLVSFFIEKKYHDNMVSSLMPWSQILSFKGEINKIGENTYEPKLKCKEDSNDMLAVFNKVGQKGMANSARTLIAIIDDEEKNYIKIKDNLGRIIKEIWDEDKKSFSCPTFSGNDLLFACIQNVKHSKSNSFILSVWDVATWKRPIEASFPGAGNVCNMSLNHSGTRLVASVQLEVPLSAHNSTFEYENVIIDIGPKGAKIIDHIPVRSIENIIYWRSDGTFVTSSDPHVFYQWAFEKRSENTGQDFDFIQRIFLYGLYERMQEKERLPSSETKPFIVPLITGYVKEYVVQSLPKRLRVWAEDVQKKYRFTS
jgi:hypothetical protein